MPQLLPKGLLHLFWTLTLEIIKTTKSKNPKDALSTFLKDFCTFAPILDACKNSLAYCFCI